MDKIAKKADLSNWAVNELASRYVTPTPVLKALARDPLSRDCFITACGHYPKALGHRMRRKDPQDHLIIYCLDGAAQAVIGKRQYAVSAGDLLIMPSGVPHHYESDAKAPWTIYWMHIQGLTSHLFMRRLSSEYGVRNIGIHQAITDAFDRLLTMHKGQPKLEKYIESAQQGRLLLSQFIAPTVSQPTTTSEQHIHTLFNSRLSENCSLEFLAEQLNISRTSLRRLTQQYFKQSPIAYFNRLKMERAALMIEQTELSIGAIAKGLGFQDALYFSRAFKKHHGLSPTNFKKRI